MACIHIRIKSTYAPYAPNREPVTQQAFWQIWVVRPMVELDEDLMALWVDDDWASGGIHPDNREGGWFAELELARGRYDRGTLLWEPGFPAVLTDG